MNYYTIATAIIEGQVDDALDAIIAAAKERKATLRPQAADFRVGDRVRIINCRPKYLNGHEATVKKINRTKVVIDLDYQVERFYTNITTPTSMIEKV